MKGLAGKRYFYRLGMREAHLSIKNGLPTLESRRWPRWAQRAYANGRFDGHTQRRIGTCAKHEQHAFLARCRHCGMRLKRREEA